MPFQQICSMKEDDSVSFAPQTQSQHWLPAVLASEKNNLPPVPSLTPISLPAASNGIKEDVCTQFNY